MLRLSVFEPHGVFHICLVQNLISGGDNLFSLTIVDLSRG